MPSDGIWGDPPDHDEPSPFTDDDAPIDLGQRRQKKARQKVAAPVISTADWRLRIIGQDPPTYALHVGDVEIRLTGSQLLSNGKFRIAYMNGTRKVFPRLSGESHDRIVAPLLEAAETINLSVEASERGRIREHLQRVVDDPPRGDDRLDLLRGRVVEIDGLDHVTLETFVHEVSERMGDRMTGSVVAEMLRDMGWRPLPNAIRIGSTKGRVWVAPITMETATCNPET
jgi:hypothetical protein